jgi:hypothetical protein
MIWMSSPAVSWSFQVGPDLLDQLVLVRAVGSSQNTAGMPELRQRVDRQLDPVADRRVLDLAHAPEVAGLDVLRQQHLAGGEVGDVGYAVLGNLEGLVVRAVFLGLLRHQADVGHRAHRLRVERAVPLAEVDDLLVDARERALGMTALTSFSGRRRRTSCRRRGSSPASTRRR